MKIGLVSPYDFSHPGGVTEHIQHLGHWLGQLGHEVRTFAPSSRRDAEAHNPGLYRIGRVFRLPANDSVARITLSFHLAKRVSEIVENEGFDVLHFHEPLLPALPLTLLRMSTAVSVGTFHAFARSNIGYYYGRSFLKPYLRHLDASIAVSAPARDFIRRYFPQIDPVVVPNGVDIDRFGRQLTPIHHLRDGCVNFLFVGRLEKRKGLGDLLKAFQHASARQERLRLIIVGDGPLRGAVESAIARRKLRNVVMAGFVPSQVLPRYYASTDVFCAPASGRESFGIVLLEAMAARLPIIATEIPGYLSVVSAGVDALTVRPKSALEMGAAMVVLARDPQLRRRMGESGAAKSVEFAWPRVAARVVDVYQMARQRRSLEVAGVHDQISSLG
ncbi:MAG: glycosyltransferase family 4 protein [Candidatus Dormibacteraceae bacterium]